MNYAYFNSPLIAFPTSIPPPPPLAPLSPIKMMDPSSANWKLPISFQFPVNPPILPNVYCEELYRSSFNDSLSCYLPYRTEYNRLETSSSSVLNLTAVKEELGATPVKQLIKKEDQPQVIPVTILSPPVTPEPPVQSQATRHSPSSPNMDPPSETTSQYETAKSLLDSSSWDQLKDHISNSCFPPIEHPSLQQMWFSAVYTLHQETKGLKRISPSVKYRLRKLSPVPVSISSVRPATNNYFSPASRSRMEEVFRVTRHPDPLLVVELVKETGLTAKQIKNFFKNKRSRS